MQALLSINVKRLSFHLVFFASRPIHNGSNIPKYKGNKTKGLV
jgi:hypothetical protein